MQTLPSFLQSLFLYALTSPTSMALRPSISDRRSSSVSHGTPRTGAPNVIADRNKYYNFLLELMQSPVREGLGRQNLQRLQFGSWIKLKTALPKLKSKHGHRYFPRAPRARLDRMPLAFGKRAELKPREQEDRGEFDRQARDRIHRMPLTFGKRFPDKTPEVGTSTSEAANVLAIPKIYSFGYISSDGNGGSLLKRQSNRLTRMPLTFGKRTQTYMENYLLGNQGLESRDSADNEKLQEESFYREGRTSLSRMPLTFGRKKKTVGNHEKSSRLDANQEHSLASDNMRDSLLIDLVGELTSAPAGEPPMSPHTDVKSDMSHGDKDASESDEFSSETSPDRKLAIHKIRDLSGDRFQQKIQDAISLYNALPVQRRTVINRMPLTFGKRERRVPGVQFTEQYGKDHQDVDEDSSSGNDQDEGWLFEGQGDGDERDTADTRERPSDDRSHNLMSDKDGWANAL